MFDRGSTLGDSLLTWLDSHDDMPVGSFGASWMSEREGKTSIKNMESSFQALSSAARLLVLKGVVLFNFFFCSSFECIKNCRS